MRTLFISLVVLMLAIGAFATKFTKNVAAPGQTSFGDTLSDTEVDTVLLIFSANENWSTISTYLKIDSTANRGCDSFCVRTQYFPSAVLSADMIPTDTTSFWGGSVGFATSGIESLRVISRADTIFWESAAGDSVGLLDYSGSDESAWLWSEDFIPNTAGVVRALISCPGGCAYQIHLFTFTK